MTDSARPGAMPSRVVSLVACTVGIILRRGARPVWNFSFQSLGISPGRRRPWPSGTEGPGCPRPGQSLCLGRADPPVPPHLRASRSSRRLVLRTGVEPARLTAHAPQTFPTFRAHAHPRISSSEVRHRTTGCACAQNHPNSLIFGLVVQELRCRSLRHILRERAVTAHPPKRDRIDPDNGNKLAMVKAFFRSFGLHPFVVKVFAYFRP